MKLLLSLLCASDNNFIIGVNTDSHTINPIELVNIPLNGISGCSGMIYSGNYLVLSFFQKKSKNDIIILNDIYEKKYISYQCQTTKRINGSLVSVYPGRIYSVSDDTQSINVILFDPDSMSFIGDSIHYVLNTFNNLKFNITSLCLWNNRWFIAIQSNEKGFIFELSNDRIVFSDIDHPNNIFFNNDQKLCFLESNKGLFHCGTDIFYINAPYFLKGVIEDRVRGGYWIGSVNELNNISKLFFMDYKGKVKDIINIPGSIVNIVKAEGVYARCF